jgi:hypothetical protein
MMCEYCGEDGTSDDPVENYVISPPVDGYEFEEAHMHKSCAARAARESVM